MTPEPKPQPESEKIKQRAAPERARPDGDARGVNSESGTALSVSAHETVAPVDRAKIRRLVTDPYASPQTFRNMNAAERAAVLEICGELSEEREAEKKSAIANLESEIKSLTVEAGQNATQAKHRDGLHKLSQPIMGAAIVAAVLAGLSGLVTKTEVIQLGHWIDDTTYNRNRSFLEPAERLIWIEPKTRLYGWMLGDYVIKNAPNVAMLSEYILIATLIIVSMIHVKANLGRIQPKLAAILLTSLFVLGVSRWLGGIGAWVTFWILGKPEIISPFDWLLLLAAWVGALTLFIMPLVHLWRSMGRPDDGGLGWVQAKLAEAQRNLMKLQQPPEYDRAVFGEVLPPESLEPLRPPVPRDLMD